MDRSAAYDATASLRAALYERTWGEGAREALEATLAPDARVHLCHPLGDASGGAGLWEAGFAPLLEAMPDVERSEGIAIAGKADKDWWVGTMGHYVGTFERPFLGIPPTGRIAQMRFHEFHRVEDGRVVEMQAIWDIPALMIQAGAWPMGPSLGANWMAPAPATGDGLVRPPTDVSDADEAAVQLVLDMLAGLQRHADEGPEAMQLERFWHPRFNWYGPAGIGTMRGVRGFRRDHQIPFLAAMPDRAGAGETPVFFAEGDYVGTTGWPNMRMSVTGGGWLGIAPSGRAITMRSLDFWRIENGRLRENWVLVDLLDVWSQLGVDVLARMRELVGPRGSASGA